MIENKEVTSGDIQDFIIYSSINTTTNATAMTTGLGIVGLKIAEIANVSQDTETVGTMFLFYAAMMAPLGFLKVKCLREIDKIRLQRPEVIKAIIQDKTAVADLDLGPLDEVSVDLIRQNYQYLLEDNE